MSNILISIIVPIFNTERFIHQCIQSVLLQTYKNWELLLIDDGSTDSSGAICDKYATEDNRIRVFHKVNGGVSSARNLGISHAKGEWIVFIDSDDWVDTHYLDKIKHPNTDADLVITGATLYDNEGVLIGETKHYESSRILRTSFDALFSTYDLHSNTSPWGKLYKKQIIDKSNLKFDEKMHHSEDAVFLYTYLIHCQCIYINAGHLYCYRYERSNSLTKCVFDFPTEKYQYQQLLIAINTICNQVCIKSIDATNNLLIRSNSAIDRVLNAIYHSNLRYKERIKSIKDLKITDSIFMIARNYKEKLLYSLLLYRLYFIYDMLRCCAKSFRKRHQ